RSKQSANRRSRSAVPAIVAPGTCASAVLMTRYVRRPHRDYGWWAGAAIILITDDGPRTTRLAGRARWALRPFADRSAASRQPAHGAGRVAVRALAVGALPGADRGP